MHSLDKVVEAVVVRVAGHRTIAWPKAPGHIKLKNIIENKKQIVSIAQWLNQVNETFPTQGD